MPTPTHHREWAARADDTAKALGGPKTKWPEWVITLRFYAALHEVEAVLLDRDGHRSEHHVDRNERVKSLGGDTVDPYMHLYRWSRDARYDCYVPDSRINGSALLLAKVRAALSDL